MSGGLWMVNYGPQALLQAGAGLGIIAVLSFMLPGYLQKRWKAHLHEGAIRH